MQVSNASPQEHDDIVNYQGAQVWRTRLHGSNDILAIKKLIDDQDISIWSLSPARADFLVQADDKVKVNRFLNERRLNHSVVVMDVQRKVDSLSVEAVLWDESTLRTGHRLSWNQYPTLRIIDEYLVSIAENFPSICKVINIGNTAENRTIKMVKISDGNPNNEVVIITAGAHSREWIAITSALYILNSIVTKFDQLPKYMKNKEWIIVPVLNPDGYEYSHTHDRLWRKNRRKFKRCRGVDVNRNFGVDWLVVGITDSDECFEGYSGPRPFSEAESIAIRDIILNLKKKPRASVDIHAYGQLILYPWSAKPLATADEEVLWTAAKDMSKAIYNTKKQRYAYGPTYRMIYPATGAAIDWLYSSGVTRAFAIETRDTGDYGFLVPPKYILDTGIELLAAVKQLSKALDPGIVKRGAEEESWF